MRSQRSYQREIAKLKQVIRDGEWVQPTYNGSPSCAFCGNQQHWGHAAECPMPEDTRSEMRQNSNGEWVIA